MKKYNFLVVLFLFFLILEKPSRSFAQSTDLGTVFTEEIHFDTWKNWRFAVKNELRMFNNFADIEKFMSKFDIGYAFFKNHCTVGIGGYLMTDFSDHRSTNLLYRVNLNISLQKELELLTLSYRFRFQNTFPDIFLDTSAKVETVLRQELKFKYTFQNVPVALFASTELFFLFGNKQNRGLESMRTKIGVDYSYFSNYIWRFYIRNDHKLLSYKPYDIYYLGISCIFKF